MDELKYDDPEELKLFLEYVSSMKQNTNSQRMQTFFRNVEHNLIEKILGLKEKEVFD